VAPEQAAADPGIDHRADIYSVGVLAYELLTGAAPFSGTPQAIISAQIGTLPTPLLEVRPELPPALAAIVMRCLAKDPADRYQTADALLEAIEALQTPAGLPAPAASVPGARRLLRIAALAVVVIGGYLAISGVRRAQWLNGTALPELRRLTEAAIYDSAWMLAREIQRVAPGDSTLRTLWPRIVRTAPLHTDIEGVRVARSTFDGDTSAWIDIGTTPIDSAALPRSFGLFRFEREGYRTVYRLVGSRLDSTFMVPLTAPDTEMVRIPGGTMRAFLVGSDFVDPLELGPYRIGRFEVTNAQYQAFVDAGGYANREYWEHPFRDGERQLGFAQAMAGLVDRTGRPGPATWEAGSFPPGQADYPVGGVSWYEAAAYAKYAGAELPTIYHWAEAASVQTARAVVPFSNLAARGPLPVGVDRGVSWYGVSDMGGNVREWIANEAGNGQRFILGGGWSDATYGFVDAYAQRPFDRSPINGIRLARYFDDPARLAAARAPVRRAFRDFAKERPVNDQTFAVYRAMYDYDPRPLDPQTEAVDSASAEFIVERVSVTAAYGGERLPILLYRPRAAQGPLQTVVFFPGSGSINGGPSAGAFDGFASWIVRSGRNFAVPIYKSTHERADSLRSDYADETIFWRDHVVMWAKDHRRALDYLSTRADVDSSRFAYFGVSWGGLYGGLVPAVEPRIKAVVLYVAGLAMERARPEADVLNFLPRVTQPVLMLNGKHDFFFPYETGQLPFYRLLGTPAEHKQQLVYEGGHDVPRTELIKETLNWLDRYLGALP
jgi:dienelactone hydrolase